MNPEHFVMLTGEETITPMDRIDTLVELYRSDLGRGNALTYLMLERIATKIGLKTYFHRALEENEIKPPSQEAMDKEALSYLRMINRLGAA